MLTARNFVLYLVIFVPISLLVISHSANSKQYKRIKYPPFSRPELRLDRYIIDVEEEWIRVGFKNGKVSFDNDVFSKNGSDYTIMEDVIGVIIVCEAKYPIEIILPSIEQVASSTARVLMTPVRISEFNEDLDEPMTQSYLLYTYITFQNIKFFSSTLTCQYINKKEFSSSTHLYKLSLDEIERKGQTIQVTFDEKQNPPQVVLPCRPASPTASIVLQKQEEVSVWENGNFSSVPVWNEYKGSKKFDPKIGITLTLPKSQMYPYVKSYKLVGLYKCSLSEGSDDDYVLVNVSQKSVEPDDNVFQPKFILKGNASFSLLSANENDGSFNSFERYKCCSGVPSKPPSLIVKNCLSLLECDVEKERLFVESHRGALIRSLAAQLNHSSDCSTYILYGISSILMCKGENVDVFQEYFQMLRTPENNGNESDIHQTFYEPHSVEWNSQVDRRIVISFGKHEQGGNHSAPTTENSRVFFMKRQHQIDKNVVEQKIFQVNSDIYDGESIIFMCFGLYLFHAEGGYIRINWKNGTKTVLEDSGNQKTFVEFSNKYFSDAISANPIFGKPIEASRDMISVECFQPVWNETRWDKMEMPLEVKASVEPVFSGSPEEIVYFNLHEKECAITFQLSQGTPVPHTIEVTKDGKSLGVMDDDENLSNITESISFQFDEGIVTIKFPTVSYEIPGTYQCTVGNCKGEAVKTIRVIVIENPSSFVTPFLICIGLITVLLCLGIGLRLWVWKKFFQTR